MDKTANQIAHEARNAAAKAAAADRRTRRANAHAEHKEAIAMHAKRARAWRIMNHMFAYRDAAVAAGKARGLDVNTFEGRQRFYDQVKSAVGINDNTLSIKAA